MFDNIKQGWKKLTLVEKIQIICISSILIITFILLIVGLVSCSGPTNKTIDNNNYTTSNYVNTYVEEPQITEAPIVTSGHSDWEVLYNSSNNNGLTVWDYRDPDTGVHYLYFIKGNDIFVSPRYSNSSGSIMQD